MEIPKDVGGLVASGALFVANHSGGKDSRAQLIKLLEVVPAEQMFVVYASLGEMEWPWAMELARDPAAASGLPFIVAAATKYVAMEARTGYTMHMSRIPLVELP